MSDRYGNRETRVALAVDTTAFTEAMREAAAFIASLDFTELRRIVHEVTRHHRVESRRASAMHAAYDRRRRARRRR